MKIIIDPYRGGKDTGSMVNSQYEKTILLELSKYMEEQFNKNGFNTDLIRSDDISLTDDERVSIINEIKDKDDLIIQNRISNDNELNIIYPLRNNDELVSKISGDLLKENVIVDKYYQRRLPTSTNQDYYSVIRDTFPNQTLIIEYPANKSINNIVDSIVNSIKNYYNNDQTYIVKPGDTLYAISKKYNISIDELKKINNLTTNNLKVNQVLKINPLISNNEIYYIVKTGDTLYSIANKNNITVNQLKEENNLINNNLQVGMKLIIPSNKYKTYIVKKGDTLYSIARNNNTTVSKIKEINNLKTNILSINQKLILPDN